VSILPLTKSGSPHIEYTNDKEHRKVASETSIVLDNEGSTGCRGSHTKNANVVVHCNEYDTVSQNLEFCNDAVAADYGLGMPKESSVPFSSIARGNESHKDGELIRDDGGNINVNAHATQNAAIHCFRTINGDTHQTVSNTNDTSDDRNIRSAQLRAIVSGNNVISYLQY
jgi:hypothetical protein